MAAVGAGREVELEITEESNRQPGIVWFVAGELRCDSSKTALPDRRQEGSGADRREMSPLSLHNWPACQGGLHYFYPSLPQQPV